MHRRQFLWYVFPTALTYKGLGVSEERQTKDEHRTDLLRKVHALGTPGTCRCACAPFPRRTSGACCMYPNTTGESHAVSSAGCCLCQGRDTAKHPRASKATGSSAMVSSKGRPTSSRPGEVSFGEIILQLCLCVFGFFADPRTSGRGGMSWDSSDTMGCAMFAIVKI